MPQLSPQQADYLKNHFQDQDYIELHFKADLTAPIEKIGIFNYTGLNLEMLSNSFLNIERRMDIYNAKQDELDRFQTYRESGLSIEDAQFETLKGSTTILNVARDLQQHYEERTTNPSNFKIDYVTAEKGNFDLENDLEAKIETLVRKHDLLVSGDLSDVQLDLTLSRGGNYYEANTYIRLHKIGVHPDLQERYDEMEKIYKAIDRDNNDVEELDTKAQDISLSSLAALERSIGKLKVLNAIYIDDKNRCIAGLKRLMIMRRLYRAEALVQVNKNNNYELNNITDIHLDSHITHKGGMWDKFLLYSVAQKEYSKIDRKTRKEQFNGWDTEKIIAKKFGVGELSVKQILKIGRTIREEFPGNRNMDYFAKVDSGQNILDGGSEERNEPKIKATLNTVYKEIQKWDELKEKLKPSELEEAKQLLLAGTSSPTQEAALVNRGAFKAEQNTTTKGEENSGELVRVKKEGTIERTIDGVVYLEIPIDNFIF